MAIREEEDFKIMERLRRRIAGIVDDPATAEALKPYTMDAAVDHYLSVIEQAA